MKTYLTYAIIGLVLVAGIGYWVWSMRQPGPYDSFAQCLKEQGVTFYGAYWCPHCQEQKKLFGRSAKHLPYVECSLPNGSGQNATCNEAKVTSYPTWEFADGTRVTGTQSLATLAERSGCALP